MCRTNELKELLNAFVDGGFETPPLCTAAQKGDLELVMLLLDKVGVDKNFKDTRGDTPLILAASGGHLPVVEALLAAGVDVDTIGASFSALRTAVLRGVDGIVDALVKKGANVNLRHEDDRTALMDAARLGHLPVVEAFLAAHADVNVCDRDGWTALHLSAREGYDGIVDALLDAGAQTNARGLVGATPLHLAARYCQLGVMKTLMAAGVDVNARASVGHTALHFSARNGRDKEVRALLRGGADKNFRDDMGQTPLVVAVYHRRLTVTKTLLASGAGVNIATNDGDTALHLAVVSAVSVDMTRLLLRWGADENALDSGGRTPAQVIDSIDELEPRHEEVRLLLDRAPADRRWRRRGWLVMLRSRTLKAGQPEAKVATVDTRERAR